MVVIGGCWCYRDPQPLNPEPRDRALGVGSRAQGVGRNVQES